MWRDPRVLRFCQCDGRLEHGVLDDPLTLFDLLREGHLLLFGQEGHLAHLAQVDLDRVIGHPIGWSRFQKYRKDGRIVVFDLRAIVVRVQVAAGVGFLGI